jgi:hypothetical protein
MTERVVQRRDVNLLILAMAGAAILFDLPNTSSILCALDIPNPRDSDTTWVENQWTTLLNMVI